MPLIDDRGRVFGRINLIDLALLVFVLLLVPLAYGAYVLFRTPPPQLLGVAPNPLPFVKGEQRVRIRGEHLRPFLRAQIGRTDARNFLIESPTAAEVVFNELPPGTYDLALFDPSEQIAFLPNALTIAPPPSPPVQFVGRFAAGDAAAALAPGTALTLGGRPAAEIVEINPAAGGGRSATLRGSCEGTTSPCVLAGTTMEPGKSMPLRAPGKDEPIAFTLDQIRMDGVWLDVYVRLFGIEEVLDLMRVGDVDRFNEGNAPKGITSGATVRTLEAPQVTDGVLTLNVFQGLVDSPPFGANVAASGHLPLKMRPAVLRMPLQKEDRGWKYRGEFIRPGSALAFETPDYFARGVIVRVVNPDKQDAAPRARTDQ
jgi:hypothetical protein